MKKSVITLLGILALCQPAWAGFKEHFDLGQEYLSNYQYSSAISEFKNALKINYLDNSARIGLVNSYLARGTHNANVEKNYDKAADDYRSALFYLSIYPNTNSIKNSEHAIVQVNGNLSKCLEFTKFDLSPKSRYEKAKLLRAEGEFAAAAYEFYQALSDKEYVADSFKQIGDIMKLFGNEQKSAEYYRKAVAVNPNDIPLRLAYAKVLDNLGSEELAVEEYNYILTKSIDNKEVLYSLERIYKKKLEKNENDADAIANLGAILQKQGKLDEALAQYQKAESIDPSNINTRINVGTLYQQKGDYRTAVVAYDSVLILYPDNIQANLYKAQSLAAQGENKAAQTYFKKVLSLDPNNEIAMNEMFNSAKASLTPAQFVDYVKKNANGANTSDILYNYALDLHKQNKLESAILVYSEITKNSTNPEVFVNLAIAQGQLKEYDTALTTLSNAKSKFPDNTQIKDAIKNIKAEDIASKFDKAAEYFNKNDFDNAIKEYAKIQPPTSDSMLGIASSYQNLGNKEKALEFYHKAFNLKPTDSDIAYYIGVLYAETEKLNEAEEYMKKALALNKNNEKASMYLESVLAQNNANLLNKAIELYENGNYKDSLITLNKLLVTDPMNPYAFYYRGMIFDSTEEKQKAINDFKNALKYGNEDELYIVNYNIAVNLDGMEKYKDAVTYYEKFLSSGAPDDELKQYASSRLTELKEYLDSLNNAKTN
ncbi:tetratricopeptide repeat protein [bacterium]|nr:tetratricopeptide repeat protein [bacterium]